MSVRIPMIPVDALSFLKPQFIGLAAWLGSSNIYPSDRSKILAHVAKTGNIDESLLYRGFDGSAENLAAAAEAHKEWQQFLAELEPQPAITFNRIINGNGHSILPPIAGGAPDRSSRKDNEYNEHLRREDRRQNELEDADDIRNSPVLTVDPCGFNGQENPDDIEF